MAATVDFWEVLYTTAQRGFDADGSAFFLLSTSNISKLTNILHLLDRTHCIYDLFPGPWVAPSSSPS
jgi:hypothetical protein